MIRLVLLVCALVGAALADGINGQFQNGINGRFSDGITHPASAPVPPPPTNCAGAIDLSVGCALPMLGGVS